MSDQNQFDESDMRLLREYPETREGDCEDYAVTLASMLEHKGNDARVVIGTGLFDGDEEPDLHAMTETVIDDEYYALDVNRPDVILDLPSYRDWITDWTQTSLFGPEISDRKYREDWNTDRH